MSIAFDIDAGMASYVGAAGVGASWGAGSDAAKAAAIDGAAISVSPSVQFSSGVEVEKMYLAYIIPVLYTTQ